MKACNENKLKNKHALKDSNIFQFNLIHIRLQFNAN